MNMRPFLLQRWRATEGSAIILVLLLTGASLLLLSAAIDWTSSSAIQTQRNNEYFRNNSAAEAAAEKVIAAMARDYQAEDESRVYDRLSKYRSMVPSKSEDKVWGNYEFTDAQGNRDKTYVERVMPWKWGELQTIYTGLQGYGSTYRIISNARLLDTGYKNIISAVKKDVQFASIPIFEFGIFYAVDLEFNPGDDWTVSGPVHGNGIVYFEPAEKLTFQSHVTAARQIVHGKSPDDPVNRRFGSVVYQGEHNGGVKSLNLPLGIDNNPTNLHGIVEIPSKKETVDSLMGRQRYYNKADMVILVSDDSVVTTSGAYNNFKISIPWTSIKSFIDTNVVFFNKRENREVKTMQIDLDAFEANYSLWTSLLGREARILYVADLRTQGANTQSGVRLVNGDLLPKPGLTVATPNPLYVQGDYNAPTMAVKVGRKTKTVPDPTAIAPASLVADAITILSNDWDDANSGDNLWNRRVSQATTINAAIIAGIVPSGGGYYSGGVENVLRLLEYWGNKTLTFNGSIVVLYPSQIATAPWGATADVYEPPKRVWNWDSRFQDRSQLPPGTPELRTIIRSQWAAIQPHTTD